MKNIIHYLKMAQPKDIIIIGDLMLDEYFFGTVNRISPEAPVPVLKEEKKEWCLGGAANVALNCKHIGCTVYLAGAVHTSDLEGSCVVSMLNQANIATQGIVRSAHRPTTCKKRILAKNHQLLRIDAEVSTPLSQTESEHIKAYFDAVIKPGAVVVLSDYAKGVVTDELAGYVIEQARKLECKVLVDPKGKSFLKYYGASFIKPNAKEFEEMVTSFNLNPTASLEQNGRELCNLLGLEGLIITLGEKGMAFVSPDYYFAIQGVSRDVFDLTGAGDTALAFLALGLANKLNLEECLKLANHAAAVAVSHLKTYAVSLDELVDRKYEPVEKIFYDWAPLKIELDWQRLDGKKVIFTNGCFDIMHPAHIHLLKECKKIGDILVVGLNTDESIKRLKGDDRPVNNLHFRSTMMAALGAVDFVVPFDQDTPAALIEYLKPDAIVKGGEYKPETMVGYDIVKAYGGQVLVIDTGLGHYSTTNIIKSMVNKNVEMPA
jgi:D-beta-D-heptose 7-phosphate kinase / D-beta-D-heptose 1-phosphate adenosyltransferase